MRAFTWTAPARVTALGATAGGLAVAAADGSVTVLEGGSVTGRWTATPAATAVFVTGNSVVAQRGRTLEVWSGPAQTRHLELPRGTRLLDAHGTSALYAPLGGGAIHLVDLASGADRVVGQGTQAALDGSRLTIAAGRRLMSRVLG